MNYIFKLKYTLAYIVLIVLINSLFIFVPTYEVFNSTFSPADMAVGIVYVLRDLSQREIKHGVIFAMLIGCFISYLLPEKQIALASLTAFVIGETIDWGIYTYTQKPLSARILSSSLVSIPFDSFVFLEMAHMMTWMNMLLLNLSKFIGVFIIWYCWRIPKRNKLAYN